MILPSKKGKKDSLILFLEELSGSFGPDTESYKKDSRDYFEALTPLESCFVFDLHRNKIIEHFGFERFLGSEKSDISLETLISIIHPQDRTDVEIILKETLIQLLRSKLRVGTNYLNLSFRMKTISGGFKNIISSNIIFTNDHENSPSKVLVKYTEADFIETDPIVQWGVDPSLMDSEIIKDKLLDGKADHLTDREKEIAFFITQGYSSSEIASKINISHHTVVTHRKNIFAKTDCHSVNELKDYWLRNRLDV